MTAMTDSADTRPAAVLVGPPGAGKTTVGRLVARGLGLHFLDSDAAVEHASGRSVPQIFASEGEAAFRTLERATVAGLLRTHRGVLALGGGAALDPGTREALRGHVVVLLDVDVDRAVARVAGSGERPLLAGDPVGRMSALQTERRPVYEAVATLRVDTSHRTAAEVADDLIQRLATGRAPLRKDDA